MITEYIPPSGVGSHSAVPERDLVIHVFPFGVSSFVANRCGNDTSSSCSDSDDDASDDNDDEHRRYSPHEIFTLSYTTLLKLGTLAMVLSDNDALVSDGVLDAVEEVAGILAEGQKKEKESDGEKMEVDGESEGEENDDEDEFWSGIRAPLGGSRRSDDAPAIRVLSEDGLKIEEPNEALWPVNILSSETPPPTLTMDSVMPDAQLLFTTISSASSSLPSGQEAIPAPKTAEAVAQNGRIYQALRALYLCTFTTPTSFTLLLNQFCDFLKAAERRDWAASTDASEASAVAREKEASVAAQKVQQVGSCLAFYAAVVMQEYHRERKAERREDSAKENAESVPRQTFSWAELDEAVTGSQFVAKTKEYWGLPQRGVITAGFVRQLCELVITIGKLEKMAKAMKAAAEADESSDDENEDEKDNRNSTASVLKPHWTILERRKAKVNQPCGSPDEIKARYAMPKGDFDAMMTSFETAINLIYKAFGIDARVRLDQYLRIRGDGGEAEDESAEESDGTSDDDTEESDAYSNSESDC